VTTPWMYEPRDETRVTSLALGVWLAVASSTMLFGALFSSYVLLRTGSATWPDPRVMLSSGHTAAQGALLALATWYAGTRPLFTAFAGAAFVTVAATGLARTWADGMVPAAHLMVACWYVLTGVHALHALGGTLGALRVAAHGAVASPAHRAERRRVLRLYWIFVSSVWVAILLCFSVR
jgi:cytochrome c oxidase subunit III